MIQPTIAAVEPRALSSSGELMKLVDLVENLAPRVSTIRLLGQGKSVGLKHLAAHFQDSENFIFLDGESPAKHADFQLAVFASKDQFRADAELRLTNWDQDDLIEYVMSKSPERCKSVMSRIIRSDDQWLGNGSPIVISAALDQMIRNENISGFREAIHAHLASLPLSDYFKARIRSICLTNLFNDGIVGVELHQALSNYLTRHDITFLTHKTVRYVLAVEAVARCTYEYEIADCFAKPWPKPLLSIMASRLNGSKMQPMSTRLLEKVANKRFSNYSSNAAGILLKLNPDWRPKRRKRINLENALLSEANWQGIKIANSLLPRVDLAHAKLAQCNFSKTTLTESNFRLADMAGALLRRANARRSNFSRVNLRNSDCRYADFAYSSCNNALFEYADLSNTKFIASELTAANFSFAKLHNANLSLAKLNQAVFVNSDLERAELPNTEWRNTTIEKTIFFNANLRQANFEDVTLSNITFEQSNLSQASMTGSKFSNCSLFDCNLNSAKLGDINWEHCDLRGAKLIGCQFHFGSSRSGLVGSPYPSHGTRTGFYTDEFHDHVFKRVEEIRKASMFGCDLRAANVFSTDFYLVDLREALYDSKQREHFQKCGAILHD